MGKRLETVSAHTKHVDEFQQALAQIGEEAASRTSDADADVVTPSRKRATSGPRSAFSPAVKLKPSKSLDLSPALQDALRHANIAYNYDSPEALLDSMTTARIERDEKLREHYNSSSASAHDTLAERFGKADGDLQTILAALYSNTPFQQVHLTDPKLEKELKDLEEALDRANEQLLSAEASELSLSDPKVRAFITKYGK